MPRESFTRLDSNYFQKSQNLFWNISTFFFTEMTLSVICYFQKGCSSKELHNWDLRVVFERVLPQLDPKNPAARDIWKRFVKFQETQSNLQQVLDACKRRATTLESSRAMNMVDLIERHSFGDCLPCPQSYKSTLLRAIAHEKTERKRLPTKG